MEIVDKELYEEIHVVPLRPTKYKIDCDSFIEEIKELLWFKYLITVDPH